MTRLVLFLAILTCFPLQPVDAQDTLAASPGNHARFAFSGPQPTVVMLQPAPHKSPVLAGTLSFLLPFGTGSFYAGNRTHGAIHAAVGVATAGLFISEAFFGPSSEWLGTWAYIGFFGFGANWIAGTVVAVLDANAYNRSHRDSAVRLSVVPQRDGRLGFGVSISF